MRSIFLPALFSLACLGAVAVGHAITPAPARVVVVEADPASVPVGLDPICEEVQR